MEGGPIGMGVGAFALTEGARAATLDRLHNGCIKDWEDGLGRAGTIALETAKGGTAGAFTVAGGMTGVALAARLGLGAGAAALAGLSGEAGALTLSSAALDGRMPAMEDFAHSAALIAGLRSVHAGGLKAAELAAKLQQAYIRTGIPPQTLAGDLKANPELLESFLNETEATGAKDASAAPAWLKQPAQEMKTGPVPERAQTPQEPAGAGLPLEQKTSKKSKRAQKPDPFVLTPESMAEAVSRSSYTDRAGQVIEVDSAELGFSQTTVSYLKERPLPDGTTLRYTYNDIKKTLYETGWPKDEPIDAVIMPPDGKLTSIDNTRLTAARELGVDKYGNPIKPYIRIRRPEEKLTEKDKARFERGKNKKTPEKWGEAIRYRIKKQRPKITGQEYRLIEPPKVTYPKKTTGNSHEQ